MNRIHAHLLVAVFLLLPSPESLAEQVIRSKETKATLIELYTSEGCSSCPPADRWLSGLKDDSGLWKELIPVGFHVDYWDYIGWRDRFARPEFSERQRRYAREGGVRVVYTPGVMLNGREWRNFRWSAPETGGGPRVGVLEASIEGSAISAHFEPARTMRESELVLNIALLGAGLSTEVEAGENRGRSLSHDFTVLALDQETMRRRGDGFAATGRMPKSDLMTERSALAFWVSTRASQAPIQAAGGWLEK